MALIVQKFGGSSVKDAERINNVADIVTSTYKEGNDVVVVVSAGLKQEVQIVFLGQGQKLRTLLGHQLFIGGDHALAVFQAGLYIGIGGLQAAHDLHHNLHLGVVYNLVEILGKDAAVGQAGELPQIQDMLDVDLFLGALGDAVLVGDEHLHHTGPHHAVAHYRNLRHHSPFLSHRA